MSDAELIDTAWRASGLDQRHFAKILNTGKRELVRMRKGVLPLDERSKAICLALLESKGES